MRNSAFICAQAIFLNFLFIYLEHVWHIWSSEGISVCSILCKCLRYTLRVYVARLLRSYIIETMIKEPVGWHSLQSIFNSIFDCLKKTFILMTDGELVHIIFLLSLHHSSSIVTFQCQLIYPSDGGLLESTFSF